MKPGSLPDQSLVWRLDPKANKTEVPYLNVNCCFIKVESLKMSSMLEREPNDPKRKAINPLLKLVLELGPLIVFFFANARGKQLAEVFPSLADLGGPIFIATALFMVAITLSLSLSLFLTGKLPIMPMVTGIVVLIFGGLTLYLQDELFIKLKPTIVNVLFGGILLGGLAFGRSLLGYVFDSVFKLDDEGWRILTFRWGVFFSVLGGR